MKYHSLKPAAVKRLSVGMLDGGINLRDGASFVEDNQLTDSKNMWFSDGLLRTRPGLSADTDHVVGRLESFESRSAPLTVTGAGLYHDGEYKQIAYSQAGDGDSYEKVSVYLIGSGGTVTSIGAIYFNRIDSETFFIPKRMFFFAADAKTGGGIYAFVTLCCDTQSDYVVFEINADFNSWNRLTSMDYYIPTILMNGRGTRYDEAVTAGSAYLDNVVELEQLNLLSGWFYAYFSTDGISSAFQLPVSGLDNQTVVCRVYRSPGNYTEWRILPDTTSATTTFYTAQVTLNCDRTTGMLNFTLNGEDYPMYKMQLYGGNNMRVYTCKTVTDGEARVIGSDRSITFNSRIYVCGNEKRANEIYSARLSNPLYFPKNAKAMTGEKNSRVTALAVQNNRLIAFKAGEIYTVSVVEGSEYSANEILVGAGNEFFETDRLSAAAIHTQIGCDCPDTVRICGNRLVWLNSDNTIYTLAATTQSNENNVYELSMLIGSFFKQFTTDALKSAFALDWDGYYLLVIGDKALVMDYRVKGFRYSGIYSGLRENAKNISWYSWEFPDSVHITSGLVCEDSIRLACETLSGDLWYLSPLCGERDTLLSIQAGAVTAVNLPIVSGFTTKMFDFKETEKNKSIDEIFITAGASDFLTVACGRDENAPARTVRLAVSDADISAGRLKTVGLIPFIHSTDKVCVRVSGKKRFAFSGIVFRYHPILEVRE